jgi:hypothetical protein
LLGVNERPNFVELDALAFEVAKRAVLILGARPRGIDEKLGRRIEG